MYLLEHVMKDDYESLVETVNELEEMLSDKETELESVQVDISGLEDKLKDLDSEKEMVQQAITEKISCHSESIKDTLTYLAGYVSDKYYRQGDGFTDNLISTTEECVPDAYTALFKSCSPSWRIDEYDTYESECNFQNYIILLDDIFHVVSEHYSDKSDVYKIDELIANVMDDEMFFTLLGVLSEHSIVIERIVGSSNHIKDRIFEKIDKLFFSKHSPPVIKSSLRKPEHKYKGISLNLMTILLAVYKNNENMELQSNILRYIETDYGRSHHTIQYGPVYKILKSNVDHGTLRTHITEPAWSLISSNAKTVKKISQVIDAIVENDATNVKSSIMEALPKTIRIEINRLKVKGEV